MRRQVLTATITAVTVAILLVGVPLAVFGAVMVRQSVVDSLTVRTQEILRNLDSRLDIGLPVDQDWVDSRVGDDGQLKVHLTVTLPSGSTLESGPALPENPNQRFEVRKPSGSTGAIVVVAVPSNVIFWRGALVVLAVAGLSIIAFVVAASVASRQARRLAAPLIYLAASAEQLGSGQVRPRIQSSGVEEIDLVQAELTRSGERMAARLASEREFAANASHQLRTPLTALSMRLEEIQMISTDPDVVEEARISLEQVERLVGVVDDLLKSSRRSDGGTTEAIKLTDVFEQQRVEWTPTFAAAGRPLVVADPGPASVLATPGALSQALATLLENSLKYGAGTTTVRVREGRVENGVAIEVADEGEGVTDELAPYIFDRHVTGGKGTGLGLGLARDLVAADGGRLELAQRRPAVFAIFLNAVPGHLDPDTVLPPGSLVVVGRRRRRR